MTLTFEDGPTVNFATNGSNILNAGGPWQAEIDGQNYMQHSADMLTAVIELKEALELPFGETAAMTCGGLEKQPIDDAFPPESAES